ncbi:MAG: Hpt domain-containing protein [Microcoleaceae cyanobacterium]
MSEQEEKIKRLFLMEAEEHLVTLENGLVDLNATIADQEGINEMFRAAHSIKGGAAMLGFTNVQKISHRLEDCFKIIKENRVEVDRTVESQFLEGYDRLKELIEKIQTPSYGGNKDDEVEIVERSMPLFVDLENNLNSIVSGGSSSSKIARDFANQVRAELKQMLEIFKQGESNTTRKQLRDMSDRIANLGLEVEHWPNLLNVVKAAVNNQEYSYRVIAPIVIREINYAGDLAQSGKEGEIKPSLDLQRLASVAQVPAGGSPSLPSDPKEVVKLLLKKFSKEQVEAIAKLLAKNAKAAKG